MKDLVMYIGDKITEAAIGVGLRLLGAAHVLFGPEDFVARAFSREDGYAAMDRWEEAFRIGDELLIRRGEDGNLRVIWNGDLMTSYEAIIQFFLEDGTKRP